MFNYVANFIQNNLMFVIAVATLILSITGYFKCLKKFLFIFLCLALIYLLFLCLTYHGLINIKLYNFMNNSMHYILLYIESYFSYNSLLKEFIVFKAFELCQMLIISSILVLILNLTRFYKCNFLVKNHSRKYIKKISELLSTIGLKIKQMGFFYQANIFNKIILNC